MLNHLAARTLRAISHESDSIIGDSPRIDALRLLVSRFSVSPKHLEPPGPSEDELELVALAALRAPDHDKLIPFRFVVASGERLERLAELFSDYGRRCGKVGEALNAERVRPMQAPMVIAVVARIDDQNQDVPVHEQWVAVGGAISNALSALHILGYAGKMLSGLRAADPIIRSAYCGPGETLLGWISIGTAKGRLKPRGEVDPGAILSSF